MRIYETCRMAINDIGRELKKCSSTVHTQTMQNKRISSDEEFNTREIQAFSFTILDVADKDKMPLVTQAWCLAEFKERISLKEVNPGNAYKIREDVWNEFLVKNNLTNELTFEYTYSERMCWQLKRVKQELQDNPETRQAIIQIHDRHIDQYRMGLKRIPCSMFYHFMKRDGSLDIIYNMRSTDFATHFQNDIWLAIALQEWMANELGIPVGKFIMFASSLHIYKRDWDKLMNY